MWVGALNGRWVGGFELGVGWLSGRNSYRVGWVDRFKLIGRRFISVAAPNPEREGVIGLL